jgi:hypothetical protein
MPPEDLGVQPLFEEIERSLNRAVERGHRRRRRRNGYTTTRKNGARAIPWPGRLRRPGDRMRDRELDIGAVAGEKCLDRR